MHAQHRAAIAAALALAILLGLAGCRGDGAPRPPDAGTDEPSHTAARPPADPTALAARPPDTRWAAPAPAAIAPSTRPASDGPAEMVDRGATARREIALTFDAGSSPGYTAAILDTLARRGVQATFGLTGAWCDANPALARRIAAEGHAVMNHSFSHASWTGRSKGAPPLTAEQRRQEVRLGEQALERATGVSGRPFFRSPYGDADAGVQRDLGALGYRYNVHWTFDSNAWRGAAADEIVARGVKAAAPGAIYIFHVAEQQDALALDRLIRAIAAAGYTFVTVPQLFAQQ